MYAKIIKYTIAVILIAAGIIGIFIPLVPGILLIIAGLFLLEIKIEKVKNWLGKLKF